jgi:N-acetylneuraminate lyase
MKTPLKGLIAATHSPMHRDGTLNLEAVALQSRHLLANRVAGAFVAGTTGESHSLTVAERQSLATCWAKVARGTPLKVIMHVGANCLADAQLLAAHAEQAGTHAIAALAPSYFRPPTVEHLVEFLAAIANAAPKTPFYFYDIPSWTGVQFPTVAFLDAAKQRIPTFAGVKFTNSDLTELQRALAFDGGRFDILWGCDESLLAGLALGCRGAVGSTYNFAAPIYHRVIAAFERGDLDEARQWQSHSVAMVGAIGRYGFTAAAKSVMGMVGVECGPARLPLAALCGEKASELKADLNAIGFFDWIAVEETPTRGAIPAPHAKAVERVKA